MRKTHLLCAALFAMPLAAQQPAAAKVGDKVPEFTFPQFHNGDGRQKLSDFIGHPLMIEFWGVH
ncbi:MAG TPA: hypothetical protein VK348_09560 [Planctomycetota bacterium]|nr:hypothetical protein [Planctomycetota bacterium]